ncbi:CGNR zinc finger domain-containing protein [Actinomadura sp. B10D3]|uniref:CGNR zinc finger domain-containing protein n=1 Tax=Actinomadura sp. B10D3 TaxID=3153557 RepID=UPI00325D3B33
MTFRFVSGNLALDFVGTLQHRRHDRRDLLRDPADVAAWITAAGLVTGTPALRPGDLEHALALREAIFRAAAAAIRGEPPADDDDRATINAAAAPPPPVPSLPRPGAAGDPVHRSGDARAALSQVARAAIDLLGGAVPGTLKECGSGTCTRLYLDTSRRGTRRWCDMRECGNRAKAAAFRARQRT